jgi:hypothetical protein
MLQRAEDFELPVDHNLPFVFIPKNSYEMKTVESGSGIYPSDRYI